MNQITLEKISCIKVEIPQACHLHLVLRSQTHSAQALIDKRQPTSGAYNLQLISAWVERVWLRETNLHLASTIVATGHVTRLRQTSKLQGPSFAR